METETWKPVIGCPELAHVEVSDFGNVRTRDRLAPSKREGQPTQLRKGCQLSPWLGRNGYKYVALKVGPQRRKYLVHRLVGRVFVAGYFDGATIDHINGNKTDNRPSNLQWVSLARNTELQWETGLVNLRGERHPSAKLTDAQALAIKRLCGDGYAVTDIAEWFCISSSLVYMIRSGTKKAWLP